MNNTLILLLWWIAKRIPEEFCRTNWQELSVINQIVEHEFEGFPRLQNLGKI
jgi:hypothetical protein